MEDIKLEQDVASVDAPPPPPAQETGRGKSSKGASGGSGGGGKKRKDRKGFLVCIGCGEQKPVSELSLTQVVDVECKRFLDRIYHQARVQGQLEWYHRQRATPEGTRGMLDFYRSVSIPVDPKGKFSFAQYKEIHAKETGVRYMGRGRMMWERQAVEFWISTEGGGLSHDEAQSRWEDWAKTHKDRGIMHDYLSPCSTKPLRLRVPVSDDVDFLNQVTDKKVVEKSETAVKKPKLEDLNRLQARTNTGFEKMGNSSGSAGMQEMAQRMVSAGSGQAFEDMGLMLDDITVLAPEIPDDPAADPCSPHALRDKVGDVIEASPYPKSKADASSGKKRKWVDIEASINGARRSIRSGLTQLKSQLNNMESSLTEAIKQIKALPPQEQHVYSGELRVGEVRLRAIQLVLGTSHPDLDAFIKSFKADPIPTTQQPAHGGAVDAPAAEFGDHEGASTLGMSKLGKAPPCGSYMDLALFSSLEAVYERLDAVSSMEGIKQEVNQYNIKKAPFTELLSTFRSAVAEFTKARKSHKKSKEKIVGNIFEEGASRGKECAILKEGAALGEVDLSSPFVVTSTAEKHSDFNKGDATNHIAQFVAVFKSQEGKIRKEQEGRSQCPTLASVHDCFIKRAKAVLPPLVFMDSWVGPSKEKLSFSGQTCTFGIVSSFDSLGTEKEMTPCVRLTFQGTRRVILTPCICMATFLMNVEQMSEEDAHNVGKQREYFKTITEHQTEAYLKQNPDLLFHATLDAGSFMYFPAGFLFAERTSTVNNVGMRLGCIGLDTKASDRLSPTIHRRKAAGKDASVLEAVLAEIAALIT